MRAGDAVLAGPLIGDALDVLACAVVEEDVVDEAVVVVERHAIAAAGPSHVLRAVERAKPDVGVESGLVERRSEVVADEHLERFGIPQALGNFWSANTSFCTCSWFTVMPCSA